MEKLFDLFLRSDVSIGFWVGVPAPIGRFAVVFPPAGKFAIGCKDRYLFLGPTPGACHKNGLRHQAGLAVEGYHLIATGAVATLHGEVEAVGILLHGVVEGPGNVGHCNLIDLGTAGEGIDAEHCTIH